jgi:hypothetical protein
LKTAKFDHFHPLTQIPYTKRIDGDDNMHPYSKSCSYLIRNPFSYCFRMVVPKDLQAFVGKTQLRYSLKTGYLGVAKYKARLLAGQVQRIFKRLYTYHKMGLKRCTRISEWEVETF